MLKMHVADNDVVGKIGRALFARGERHGNQARAFVRHCPGGRHRPNRNNKRNCEDKSDEQLAQFTPSMNCSIISMLPNPINRLRNRSGRVTSAMAQTATVIVSAPAR
jgi:hypothetical protein